jgi:hypothetical protein
MAESFNPYRDWLGLADGQRPATHYGLLGLEPLEDDAAEIRSAIMRLLAKLGGIRPGSRMPEWQEIIQEISIATDCLTNGEAKAAYDAQLRGSPDAAESAPRGVPVAPPPVFGHPEGIPPAAGEIKATRDEQGLTIKFTAAVRPATGAPPIATPPAATPGRSALSVAAAEAAERSAQPPIDTAGDRPPAGEGSFDGPSPPKVSTWPQDFGNEVPELEYSPNYRRRPKQASITANLAIRALLLTVAVLATLIGLAMYMRHADHVSVARVQHPKLVKVAKPADAPSQPSDPAPEKPAAVQPPPKAKAESLQPILAEVVAALAKRDILGARGIMAEARANAESPDDQKTLIKYQKLSADVEGFWRIVGDRVSKFKPSEEVPLGKTRIIVVESGDGRFSVKYGSRIFRFTAQTMPSWLAIALVDSNLGGDGPSKELYGAFLAVDPEGDRSRARALWSEAASAGIQIDQLLPSLDSLPSAQKQ